MKYSLFIDDERYPPDDEWEWLICRDKASVEYAIALRGFPSHISFDHDLGEDKPTGMDIARWITNLDMDSDVIPDDFTFDVHSQNPVGAENIRLLMNNYLNFKRQSD